MPQEMQAGVNGFGSPGGSEAITMAWDDDQPQKKPRERVIGADLSDYSVEELNEYLAVLADERERVEAVLVKKKASRQSAQSVFKS
jgi:uncharacterized small protein (DUF1192 family)